MIKINYIGSFHLTAMIAVLRDLSHVCNLSLERALEAISRESELSCARAFEIIDLCDRSVLRTRLRWLEQ